MIAHVAVSSSLTEDEILRALRIPNRIAARRKASALPLKPLASELIYRLSKVVVTATDVLGSRAKAREWILAKNRALHGERPIDLLAPAGSPEIAEVAAGSSNASPARTASMRPPEGPAALARNGMCPGFVIRIRTSSRGVT